MVFMTTLLARFMATLLLRDFGYACCCPFGLMGAMTVLPAEKDRHSTVITGNNKKLDYATGQIVDNWTVSCPVIKAKRHYFSYRQHRRAQVSGYPCMTVSNLLSCGGWWLFGNLRFVSEKIVMIPTKYPHTCI